MKPTEKPLYGRRIALPESRQLDVMAAMLEKRGASLLRCPLVAIHDTPDRGPVVEWLNRCIETPFDDFIILTGEGLRRLLGFADVESRRREFVDAVAHMRTFARGPKPGQALKEIGLRPSVVASTPTTDGVIATFDTMDIQGRRVGVQLYGEDPNPKLVNYLKGRGALVDTVAPYVYAPDSEEEKVCALIDALAAGSVDAIAFTSQPQLKRLLSVARKHGLEEHLSSGLNATVVAAVGPVVADALKNAGVRVDMMPDTNYFMKPMVARLTEVLTAER